MSSQETFTPVTPQELATYNDAKIEGMTAGMQWASALILAEALDHAETAHFAATHDELTGLYNRKGLDEVLSHSGPANKAMLYVDGTNQKKINDMLGHDKGDEAIIGTADTILNSLRPNDIAARIGGDEFLVVLDTVNREEPPSTPEEQLTAVTGRIAHNTLAFQQINPDLTDLGFDIAVGGAIWEPGMTVEDVQKRAETNMYAHKQDQHAANGAYRPHVN